MIGTTLSHYRIESELGRGGMGVVYKAVDTELNRTVALKFLPANVVATDQDRQRFRREAQAAAALSHPNIATVFAIEETDEHAFIAMEYVDGETLRDLIEKGPIKVERAIEIAVQVAEGLQIAHEHSIVHRDIKPANIMISSRGHVKIMDFGLAKVSAASMLTQAGSTIGTIGYMSPEQARGDDIDRRTDIWGLGCVLFEMITGRPPFSGEYEQAIVYSILNSEPPALTSLRSGVPLALEGIIAKILAKDPSFRYQHVDELPADLKAVLAGASTQMSRAMPAFSQAAVAAHAPGPHSGTVEMQAVEVRDNTSSKALISWGVAGVMTLVAIVLFAMLPQDIQPEPVRRTILPLNPSSSVLQDRFDISDDGSTIVFETTTDFRARMYARRLDGTESIDLGPAIGSQQERYSVSPQGTWVAYRDGDQLYRVSTSGGNPELLSIWADNGRLTWRSDSELVLVRRSGDSLVVDTVLERELIREFEGPLPEGYRFLGDVDLIAEHNVLLYTSFNVQEEEGFSAVRALDLNDGTDILVAANGEKGQWIENGYVVFERNGDIHAVPFDPASLERGISFSVIAGVAPVRGFQGYDASRTGELIYLKDDEEEGSRSTSILFGSEADNLAAFERFTDRARDPRFSPDGSRVLIHSQGGGNDIWLLDRRLGTAERMTTIVGEDETPVWDVDGVHFYYAAGAQSDEALVRSSVNNTSISDTLFMAPGHLHVDSISRDGRWVFLGVRQSDTGSDIFAYDTTTGVASVILDSAFNEGLAYLSPDGDQIVYMSDDSGVPELYLNSFPAMDRRMPLTSGGGIGPLWSESGESIYYSQVATLMRIQMIDGVPQRPEEVMEFDSAISPEGYHRNFDMVGEGEEFVFIDVAGRTEADEDEIQLITGLKTLLEQRDSARAND